MGQDKFEKDRNRFSLSERLTVELFLISYLFIFFISEATSYMPYIWLLFSLAGGVLSYLLFLNKDYSFGLATFLGLVLTLPMFLFGMPTICVVLFFIYVLWRIQANFNGSRVEGWPFFAVNTTVFVVLTFIGRMMFTYNNPEVLVKQQIILYLLISFLYYFIRMITISVNSRQLGNFKIWEAGRIFSFITGLGALVFLVVLFALQPIRSGFIVVFSFLFGGVLSVFGKVMDPILEYFKSGAENFMEENMEEPEVVFDDFQMDDEVKVFGATSSVFEYSALIVTLIVITVIIVILIRKKKEKRYVEKQEAYTYSFKGKRQKTAEARQLRYDYSSARDEVRKSFEQFEKEAQELKYDRLQGETVKEWFQRMGWGMNEEVFSIYDNVRYGSQIPTEMEHTNFMTGLEKIKKRFFEKEV